jgi:hypothetical protein
MQTWTVEGREELEFPTLREVRLRLSAGDVAITAGPPPARLEVVRRHGRPVVVVEDDGFLDIAYDAGDDWERWARMRRDEAQVVLTAPPDTELDLAALSATVVVGGFSGEVRASSVSGDVALDDLAGKVRVRTVSGDVDARGLNGPLRTETVSGDLAVAQGHCPSVRAKAVSGDVTLDLTLEPSGDYEFNTLSGDVLLRVNEGAGVDIRAASMSGRIKAEFPLEHQRGFIGQRAEGSVGDGSARLRVKTLSGKVALVRPATV